MSKDRKGNDVFDDQSTKLLRFIKQDDFPNMEINNIPVATLNETQSVLPIDDQWAIKII